MISAFLTCFRPKTRNFFEVAISGNHVKSQYNVPGWLDKKFDMQGVVFLTGSRQYMQYVAGLSKTSNEGGRAFYDAIISNQHRQKHL